MTATLAIAALKTTLTALANEDSSATIQTIWTNPPEDPATGNFPALVIEYSPDDDFDFAPKSAAAPGDTDYVYPINMFVFVGAPAAGNIGEMHDRAILWPKPVYTALVNNANLGATVVVVGDSDTGNLKITGRIGGITWNGVPLYGVHFKLWLSEFIDL